MNSNSSSSILHAQTRCRPVHVHGLTAGQKTVENLDRAAGHTAVKRKNPTPLPVFAASNFEFEEKTCKTSVGKCYKNSTVRENYKLGGL